MARAFVRALNEAHAFPTSSPANPRIMSHERQAGK
jgi:hypothetical protein